MSWLGLEAQDHVVAQFRRALTRGRLASSFLFVGPPGVGKRAFAQRLAQCLLCQRRPTVELNPCGECASCRQVLAGTHPDLLVVSKPKDRAFIPLELLIGAGERRMREGLCHDVSLRPLVGQWKVAVIDDADSLNIEGANCLLKTLEEPPTHAVMILVGTSPEKQLPTIRSRCQMMHFQPLPTDVLAELLLRHGIVTEPEDAPRIAAYAEGSLEHAAELADPALWKFRGELLDRLAHPRLDSLQLAAVISTFVEEAGREAPARRARTRQVVRFAIDFYRALLRHRQGLPLEGDEPLKVAASQATGAPWNRSAIILAAMERSLETLGHIDRNAHQAASIEAWCDDLARLLSAAQLSATQLSAAPQKPTSQRSSAR